jgi:6-phosphogluconolactonase
MTVAIHRVSDVNALHASAAAMFVSTAVHAVRERGSFRVALAGGTTPKGVYSLLADDDRLRSQVAWDQVQFFWGDERHVGPDHADSNFRMAQEAMLNRLPINASQVWRIKGEYPDAARAAEEYERDLWSAFGAGPEGAEMPRFDLVLLGMGPDGHTASLFPGTDALRERRRLVVANRVEQLNTERITLTPPVLNNAAEVVFLVRGPDKAGALKAVIEGSYQPDQLPAQLIRPLHGRVLWLVDPSAARLLSTVNDAGG